jgi:hypothetical protein
MPASQIFAIQNQNALISEGWLSKSSWKIGQDLENNPALVLLCTVIIIGGLSPWVSKKFMWVL